MCGEEPDIRIKQAGNGHVIETYTPGTPRGKHGERTPGKHEKLVATSGHHVIKLLSKRLLGSGKGKEKVSKKSKKKSAQKRA